jgi:hypothetical protein
MSRARIFLMAALLPLLLIWATAATNAAPLAAISLPEGRSFDQIHDTGYIDWSGSARYVYLTHKDGATLPPEEGGIVCMAGCTEWVTRLGDGAVASGSFDRDVSYFEIMIGFTPDESVGMAVLRACSSVKTWPLQTGSGLPGFVSMDLTVPAGCRTWSLTASGGYVDYRSLDVYYIGPPATFTPTPTRTFTFTPTVTRTPTMTFTPTATLTPSLTPTLTFTPTATFTNTPSPTPTPLPPVITGQVVCDLWGNAGWCRGDETLELSASDPQGFAVTIDGDLNGVPFSCGASCNQPLAEGVGTAQYRATSTSGRTASGSSTWKRDVTPPLINVVVPPIDGRNGWHVSNVTLSATATDAISGLAVLEGSADNGATWTSSFPLSFTDGVHSALIHAQDVAGNETTASKTIRVDTVPPAAQFTSHTNGELVRGEVTLRGTLTDMTSGIASGEISVDGVTWQAVTLGAGDTWSFSWHSNEVPNGQYVLQIRGTDKAGNLGDAALLKLVVDNGPPSVSIAERWWIWESGALHVSPNHFPIASVQVTISDPQKRWLPRVIDFNPNKIPDSVTWDRRFADGALAPSGEYRVVAVACDIHDLCGSDSGVIMIPVAATATVTASPSPTATFTQTPQPTMTATQLPATVTPVQVTPTPQPQPAPPQRNLPFWQVIGLLGLFLVITSASVVDPRPKALDRLRETLKALSGFEEKQDYKVSRK